MRLALCYRVLRARGYFIGKAYRPYRSKTMQYLTPSGFGTNPRFWAAMLTEQALFLKSETRGKKLSRYPRLFPRITNRYINLGFIFLRTHSPFLEAF